MLRIVATVSLRDLLEARGIAENVRQRIMRHGEITCAGGYFDILVDRDANDLPDAVVAFLRNRAEIVYVAEFQPNAQSGSVLKGADPGVHRFLGVPV